LLLCLNTFRWRVLFAVGLAVLAWAPLAAALAVAGWLLAWIAAAFEAAR
jgi:hypothetical protein